MKLKSFLERTRLPIAKLAELGFVTVPAAYTWLADKSVPKYEAVRNLLLNGCRLDEIFDDEVLEAVRRTHAEDFNDLELLLTPEKCKEIVKSGLSLMQVQGNAPTLNVK